MNNVPSGTESPGQRFIRKLQTRWQLQQQLNAEVAKTAECNEEEKRRRAIEEYWTNALSQQTAQQRMDDRGLSAQQKEMDTDAVIASQPRLLRERMEQLKFMKIAHATSDSIKRIREQCKLTSVVSCSAQTRLSLPQVIEARAHLLLQPTHGVNELELLLLEHRSAPVSLLVAIRVAPGSEAPESLANSLSVVAFASWLADRTVAVCLSIEPDPGFELMAAIYSCYEVALYASHRLDPILQGVVELQPYGGWHNFHRVLENKSQARETFVCRRAEPSVSPQEIPAKHTICATPKLLYHELHEHRMIPLELVVHLARELCCINCATPLCGESDATAGHFACPDCAQALCIDCANSGSGVMVSAGAKYMHLNSDLSFKIGTIRLQEFCEAQLDQVARFLKEYPLPVCVEGYANFVRPDGTIADDNALNKGEEDCTLLELARRRAQRVTDGLVERGVLAALLTPVATGRLKLVTRDPSHIADNMRVDLFLKTSPEQDCSDDALHISANRHL